VEDGLDEERRRRLERSRERGATRVAAFTAGGDVADDETQKEERRR
jgi:hypothetical protein